MWVIDRSVINDFKTQEAGEKEEFKHITAVNQDLSYKSDSDSDDSDIEGNDVPYY